MSKLIIVLGATAVAHLANRAASDAAVLANAGRAIAGAEQHGYGSVTQPTVFNIDGEKVKVYKSTKGDVTVNFTGAVAEKPKNAPIDLPADAE